MSRRKRAPKRSHLAVVLDRSGSMTEIALETKQGFDRMVDKLREDGATGTFTLVQFDTEIETVYEQKAISDVPELVFVPRGMTALFDAIGETIRRLEKFVKPGEDVAITIMTDGKNNSSHEFTKESIAKLMDQKREVGWEFNYLGAGPNSWHGAQALRIGDAHTINYAGDGHSHEGAFEAMAMSSVAKTRGLSSSYASAAPVLKASLEADANVGLDPYSGLGMLPDNDLPAHLRRRRGSGKPTKS